MPAVYSRSMAATQSKRGIAMSQLLFWLLYRSTLCTHICIYTTVVVRTVEDQSKQLMSTPLPTMQQTHEDGGSLVQSLVWSVVGALADLHLQTHILLRYVWVTVACALHSRSYCPTHVTMSTKHAPRQFEGSVSLIHCAGAVINSPHPVPQAQLSLVRHQHGRQFLCSTFAC